MFAAELGDFNPDEHGINYLSRLQLLPGQTEEIERKISIQRKVRFRPSDDIWIVLMICKDKEHIDSNTYQRAE